MSETQKKVALSVVVVVAFVLVFWQGINFVSGPRLEYGKPISTSFSATHTGKAAMMGADRGSAPNSLAGAGDSGAITK